MSTRVAINGFGRVGRQSLKALIERAPDVEVVAINDLVSVELDALLFKHDSTYGTYPGVVGHTADALIVDGHAIRVFQEKDPADLPWGELGVDIVIESPAASPTPRRPGPTSRPAPRRSSSAPRPRARTSRSSSASTRTVRPGQPPHHLQRLVHDELPGAG